MKLHLGRSSIPWVRAGTAQHLLPGASRGVLTRAKLQKTHWRIRISVTLKQKQLLQCRDRFVSFIPSDDLTAVGIWCFSLCPQGHTFIGVRVQSWG